MDIRNKNICFACAFAAPYGGNFIRMCISLAERLVSEYGCKVYFIFPKQPDKDWLIELKNRYTVSFTTLPYDKCEDEIYGIINQWHIDLVHTHFDVYDVPVAKAVKKIARPIQMVWHLHDYLSLDKTGLSLPWVRKFFTNQRLYNQYGKWGRQAYFIGVSAEVTNIAAHYRNHRFSYPVNRSCEELSRMTFPNASVIINGIDLERLKVEEGHLQPEERLFTFLTFGGEAVSKGVLTIFSAAEILHNEGLKFKIKITNGYTTESVVSARYGNEIPQWLEVISQTDNVVSIFGKCDCYISASLKETMSMAIAEASIYGLPVIQSDIPGTWWNSRNPSTFIFKKNNAVDLALKMKSLMEFDSRQLKDRCYKTSKSNRRLLSMDSWVDKIMWVYKNI